MCDGRGLYDGGRVGVEPRLLIVCPAHRLASLRMPESCTYPSCGEAAAGSRGLVMQPDPIMVNLCAVHTAIVDANRNTSESQDFWRWFDAMSGRAG